MKTRKLKDLEVSAIGYGCMGLSMGYGATPDKSEALNLINHAYQKGCTFFDTAEIYANGDNEKLIGEALYSVREKVVLATKFMLQKNEDDNSKERLLLTLREKLEKSLQNLQTDYIDLYYQHRVNKDIPVEDVAWCMGEFIREGKIKGWGQSNATVEEIRRAHAVTPLTAIQSEYSIMSRQYEEDVIPTCKELGIGFVAYSPLASGFLTGKVDANTDYVGFDARRVIPRFKKENRFANQPLLNLLHHFADEKNATPAQVSLAWMLHKNDFIVPIPGSRKPNRIDENLGAAAVELNDEEFAQLEEEVSKIQIHGEATSDEDMAKLRNILAEEAKR